MESVSLRDVPLWWVIKLEVSVKDTPFDTGCFGPHPCGHLVVSNCLQEFEKIWDLLLVAFSGFAFKSPVFRFCRFVLVSGNILHFMCVTSAGIRMSN